MRELRLYTTLGCHLCEQAQALITPLINNTSWCLRLVDIADDDELMSRYGIRIPVLYRADLDSLGQSVSELGWPFDRDSAIRFLALDSNGE